MDQFVTMIVTVVVSLAAAGAVFVGANRAVDQSVARWPVFTAVVGSVVGAVAGAALQHNGWLPAGPALGGPFKAGWLTIVAVGGAGAAVGTCAGRVMTPTQDRRSLWEGKLRPWVFVGPALAFVAIGLVIPGLRTIFLSFKNGPRGRQAGFTFEHYQEIFTNDEYFTVEGWSTIFTGRLFITGLAAAVVAGLAAWASAARIAGGARRAGTARRLMRILGIAATVLAVAQWRRSSSRWRATPTAR